MSVISNIQLLFILASHAYWRQTRPADDSVTQFRLERYAKS